MERGAAAEALAVAVAAGNLDAFELLVRTYQDRLFNFALRLCGSAEDAEEIVQDSFVKAHRALTAARTPAHGLALTPWLYKIALNTAHNHRRGRRPATVSLEGHGSRAPADAASAGDPQQHLLSAEAQDAIARALLALPLTCRAAVVLRFIEGLPYEAISRALGVPPGTAKSHVFRGSRRLRKLLRGDGSQRGSTG